MGNDDAGGEDVTGRRLPDGKLPTEPGEYGRLEGGWYVCCPNGMIGNVSRHTVVEHEDGTITVSPSILVSGGPGMKDSWHGYLRNGVWSEA